MLRSRDLLLLHYCLHITFYLLLKVAPVSLVFPAEGFLGAKMPMTAGCGVAAGPSQAVHGACAMN